ncbi:amidohydrolase [Flavisolibacter sp. BT320]|nr:amidohydrolase [Flavisolibacter longurius]
MKQYSLPIAATIFFLTACAQKKKADLLLHNGKVYTVDASFSVASAMAIKDGKILEVGDSKTLLDAYDDAEKIDAGGKAVYPGFIDAHAHFLGYGLGLQSADLVETKSWNEILERLQSFAKTKNIQPGQWIVGRGWDQNDWPEKDFPTREKLDALFPNNPVLLTRVDGHAAVANQKALEAAGVTISTKITGGDIEVKNGQLTGVLIDNAVDLVSVKIPSPNKTQTKAALLEAQQNCFAMGLTTIDDCGVSYQDAQLFDEMHKSGELKMRIYAMLSDAGPNYQFAKQNGKIKTPHLNVSSFKVYADGALGSRGACLLHPYTDRPNWQGFLLSPLTHFDSVANVLHGLGWQMNTHAIGDSGNRAILNIYGKYLKGKNDRRWRIEHSQVVNKSDFSLFAKYSVVPSVQPTHATSDMYWAEQRLGADRVKGAYAFKDLMKQNGWIPLGTDFPVEDISPFKTFLAAVFRVDASGYPQGGYQMENALSRQDALRGMTIWAAKSNFEEGEKGSLEKGKWADFIILDQDLMEVTVDNVLKTSVQATYVGGKHVFQKR